MTPRRTQRKTERGRTRFFTLVEVIVSMAIMVFVALIIATASMSFYNTWRRAGKITNALKTNQTVDRIVDLYFRNMIPFTWKDENNEPRFVFEGKNDSILFTSLRRSYSGDSGALTFIRLFVEDEQLIAEYSPYPRPPWEEEGKYTFTREVLCGNVSSISFLYAEKNEDEEGGLEWLDVWEEDDHEAIPLAVQMTVEWKDGRTERWLRRTAGSGKYSTFGYRRTPALD